MTDGDCAEKREIRDGIVYRRVFDEDFTRQPIDSPWVQALLLSNLFLYFFTGLWIASSGDIWSDLIARVVSASASVLAALLASILIIEIIDNSEYWSIQMLGIAILYPVLANVLRAYVIGLPRGDVFAELAQLSFWGFALLQGVVLSLAILVSTRPIDPDNKLTEAIRASERPEFPRIHLENWWRVGQIALSLTVLIGLLAWAFPRGGSEIGRENLTIAGSPFVISLGFVLLYIVTKMQYLEEAVMNELE